MQTVIGGPDRFGCLPALPDRDSGDTPAVCVPAAASVLDDQAYAQEEMRRLAGMGFPVTALPLTGTSKEPGTARLQHVRLVIVTGGNAFCLRHHAILRPCLNPPDAVVGEAAGIDAGLLLRWGGAGRPCDGLLYRLRARLVRPAGPVPATRGGLVCAVAQGRLRCRWRVVGAGFTMPVMGSNAAGAGLVVGLLGPVEIGPAGAAMTPVAQPRMRVLLGLLGWPRAGWWPLRRWSTGCGARNGRSGGSGANLELVRSLGAATVIDYTTEDFTQNQQPYDVIFDAVGKRKSAAALRQARRTLASGGICISVDDGTPKLLTRDLALLKELAETKAIRPVIDRCYRLEQMAEAHRYVDGGRKKGNVVVTVSA